MVNLILVATGGAAGALTRYVIDKIALTKLSSSIAGTFFVNVSGSFLLGLLAGFLLSHPSNWSGEVRLFLAVGFLGSYTTFSTFSMATVNSLESGDFLNAATNIGSSVVFGLLAAAIGLVIGKGVL